MPRTLTLPDALDGAKLLAHPKPDGSVVRAGEPIALYELDGKQVPVPADADSIVLRALGRPGVRAGAGAPIAIVGAPGESIGWDPGMVRPVRMLVQRRCDECGNDYPVNGLVNRVRCTRCGDVQRAPAGFWRDYLLEDITIAREPGHGSGGSVLAGGHGPCTRQCWGIPPLCRACTTVLDWNALVAAVDEANRAGSAIIACSACNEPHRGRPPPAWAAEVWAGLVFLVGETAELGEQAAAAKPIVFKCPSCMAPLQIDGVKRIVRCKYCESDVYLPDDLWLHLHPAAKRARWWMLFKP